MGSVSLGVVNQIFQKADIDGNGRLDRPEIAKEALAAFGSGDTDVGAMLATLVQGGVQGQGLFPDSNRDNQLSFDEMVQFAGLGGDPNGITPDDFRAGFGSQATAQGQGININALQSLASQNISKFSGNNLNQSATDFLQQPSSAQNASEGPASGGLGGNNLMLLAIALLLGNAD